MMPETQRVPEAYRDNTLQPRQVEVSAACVASVRPRRSWSREETKLVGSVVGEKWN